MPGKSYHHVRSAALSGVRGLVLEIEVSLLAGLPHFEIAGSGGRMIRDSRDRVRAAIVNSGYKFPRNHVIASCAPLALPRQGRAFDLPLALALLAAAGQIIHGGSGTEAAYLGELSLDGRIRPVQGLLGRLLALRDAGITSVAGPLENQGEASFLEGMDYEGLSDLKEAVRHFSGIRKRQRQPEKIKLQAFTPSSGIMDRIVDQEEGLRACLIAAAGWHPLLLMGSPGSGKTLLANGMRALLPPPDQAESLELLSIRGGSGAFGEGLGEGICRPFRQTHHNLTVSALVGGGILPLAGECTLAHRGILFLDELTEAQPRVLDALRQPLESKSVYLARAGARLCLPADFLLVAACNPCRCGNLLEAGPLCRCPDTAVRRHLGRISGPLYDRFDLVTLLTRPRLDADCQSRSGVERSMREAVGEAWQVQRERAGALGKTNFHNSSLDMTEAAHPRLISPQALEFAYGLARSARLTARSFHAILRVARTIADLAHRELVSPEDIAEATHYKAPMPGPPAGT